MFVLYAFLILSKQRHFTLKGVDPSSCNTRVRSVHLDASQSSSSRETHPSAARSGDKKEKRTKKRKEKHHGQKEYGRAGKDSPGLGNAMDEPLTFGSAGHQLAHLNEVLGRKVLQAKKAEGRLRLIHLRIL